MCGIVGLLSNDYTGTSYLKKKRTFSQLLFADTLRGTDSTGVFAIPTGLDPKPLIIKRAMAAPDFLDLKPVDTYLSQIEKFWASVGHNRAATRGKVNNQNAHPFNVGHITLVHNGSLVTTHGLPEHEQFDVDSHAIAHTINKVGIENCSDMFNGAFALVWHDDRNNTINLFRNSERPLYFSKTVATGNTSGDILIASEFKMAEWIAYRNGYEVDKTYAVGEGSLIVFHKEDIRDYEVKKLKLREPTKVISLPYHGRDNDKKPEKILPNLTKYKDNKIEVLIKDYVPYANQKRGCLIGTIYADDKVTEIQVKIPNIHEDDAEFIIDEWVECTIVSGAPKHGKYTPIDILWCKDHKVIEELSDDSIDGNTEPDKSIIKFYNGPGGRIYTAAALETLLKQGCCQCGDPVFVEQADDLQWTNNANPVCPGCIADYEALYAAGYTH